MWEVTAVGAQLSPNWHLVEQEGATPKMITEDQRAKALESSKLQPSVVPYNIKAADDET